MWILLLLAVVAPLLIINQRQWRLDLARIHGLKAAQTNIPSLKPTPKVSILLAAWNEEASVRSCMEAIERLDYPNLEIILCAGGTDGTWKIASALKDPRVILVAQQAGDGKQKSLQRCLEKAGGEIIYLLDAGGLITDAAFTRILTPILQGDEEVVTSSPYTPLPEQLGNPFVLSQCASRLYTALYQGDYSSNVLGASAAIWRQTLEQAGGFATVVRTGTDYDLGKRLLRAGKRVRFEVNASFPVEFQTRAVPYIRQQARWIRNVVLHGLKFGAYGEVASCLSTSLVGLTMLILPPLTLALALSSGFDRELAIVLTAVWIFLFLHAFLSRIRYMKVAERWLGQRFPRSVIAWLPLFLLIDFAAWATPLYQYPTRAMRERW